MASGEAAPADGEESAGASDASMAGGNPPGIGQQAEQKDGDGQAQHIAAKEEVPHDKEEDVSSRLLREVQALSEKLDKKDKENAELAEKMWTIESQMHYQHDCGPWWSDNDMGQYCWGSSSSWQGQSSRGNGGGGWGGGGWGQDSGGGGRAGRSRDRGSRERDERRESPPRHHRGGSGAEPGIYKAEAIEASKAEKKYRPCALAYASKTTGLDDSFITSPTQRCRHCPVINWAANSPDDHPKYGAPFPCGLIEEEDFQNYLSNIAKSIKDWSCPETRAHSFSTSLWNRNYFSNSDNNDLSTHLSRRDLLWKPALLSDPEHKGEQGWLCLWYKDTKNVTLFCRHCKRSTGFVRCSKDRDKISDQCRGHEPHDDDEWPVLAGSNLDHQRYIRALLTNVTGVQWAESRER